MSEEDAVSQDFKFGSNSQVEDIYNVEASEADIFPVSQVSRQQTINEVPEAAVQPRGASQMWLSMNKKGVTYSEEESVLNGVRSQVGELPALRQSQLSRYNFNTIEEERKAEKTPSEHSSLTAVGHGSVGKPKYNHQSSLNKSASATGLNKSLNKSNNKSGQKSLIKRNIESNQIGPKPQHLLEDLDPHRESKVTFNPFKFCRDQAPQQEIESEGHFGAKNTANMAQQDETVPLELLKMDSEVASQKMVPFDRAPYTQTLVNPHPLRSTEIISVQFCKQQVQEHKVECGPITSSTSQIEGQLVFKCGEPTCDALELDLKDFDMEAYDKKTGGLCTQCGELESKRFLCSRQHVTCSDCMLLLVKQRMLKAKTSQFYKFQKYHMTTIEREEAVHTSRFDKAARVMLPLITAENIADGREIAKKTTIKQQKSRYEEGELLKTIFNLSQKRQHLVEQIPLADLRLDEEKMTPQERKQKELDDEATSYALLGFWRQEGVGLNKRFVCYATERINYGIFLKPNVEAHAAPFKQFLYLSSDNRLFYFIQTPSVEQDSVTWKVEMKFLNLERVIKNHPTPQEISEQVFMDPFVNKKYEDIAVGLSENKDAQQLLDEIFGTPEERAIQNDAFSQQVLPQLICLKSDDDPSRTFGDGAEEQVDFLRIYDESIRHSISGTFLVLHSDAIKEVGSGVWSERDGMNNLSFIRVDSVDTVKLSFTIETADLFIGLRSDTIYFLRETSIIFWKWGQDLCQAVRCFPKLKSNSKDYVQQQYKFQLQQDQALERAYLLEGFVHNDDQDECVTVNYKGEGLYTFSTKQPEGNKQIRMYPFKGTICIKKNKPQTIEFEAFFTGKTITTLNFKVDDEDIDSCPIEKPYSTVEGQQELDIWVVMDDNQPPIRLFGTTQKDPRSEAQFFTPREEMVKGKLKTQNFELIMSQQRIAQSKYQFEKIRDAVVTTDTDGKKVAFGNVTSKIDKEDSGYNILTLSVYRLDKELEQTKKKSKVKTEKLKFRVPTGFCMSKDSSGKFRLPVFMMTPVCEYQTDDENKSLFQLQLFYQDWKTQESSTVLLQGTYNNGQQEESVDLYPQWLTLPSEDMIVSYPLMAYKSLSPMDNEIVFCNLATNEPQKVVDISPARFVAFINMGLNASDYDVNSNILFLVSKKNDKNVDVLRVMKYSQFPFSFKSDSSGSSNFQMKGQISLLQGAIPSASATNDDINALCREKIRSCSLLERERVDGKAILLVLQLVDRIYQVSMNKDKEWDSKVQQPTQSMLRFMMQRGPDQEIYYVEQNKDSKCQQIVRITLPFDPAREIMETFHGEKILSFNLMIDGGVQSREIQGHALFFINNKSVFSKFTVENKDSEMKHNFSVDLKGEDRFANIISQLDDHFTQWPSVICHERGLTAFEKIENLLTSTTVSFEGAFATSKDFLKDNNALNRVLYCHDCPWVSQELLQVRESDFHYWLVQNCIFSRRIDLMKPDQYFALTGVDEAQRQLIGNSFIALKIDSDFHNKTLLFSQKTFQYVKALDYRNLKPLSNVLNDKQYFGASGFDDWLSDVVIFTGEKMETISIEQIFDACKEVNAYTEEYTDLIENDLFKVAIDSEEGFNLFVIKETDDVDQLKYRVDLIAEVETSKISLLDKVKCFSLYIAKCTYEEEENPDGSKELKDAGADGMPRDIKVFYTKDYLVIVTLTEVIWKSFRNLANNIAFTPLPFSTFDPKILKQGFKVQNVTKHNIRIAEKGEPRENLIQISFSKVSILWDLEEDENREVVFVERVDQLFPYNSYTQTGLMPHDTVELKEDSKLMKKAPFAVQNEFGTLMYNQANKSNIFGQIFANFAMLDLLEIMNIKESYSKNIFVPKMDLNSTVSNFNGQTFFEIFKDDSTYIELMEEQIMAANLEQAQDEAGVKSDNIILRRLYWTLLLPTNSKGNNAYGLLGKYDPVPEVYDHVSRHTLIQKKKTNNNFSSKLWSCVRYFVATSPVGVVTRKIRQTEDNKEQEILLSKNILQRQLINQKYHLLDPLLRLVMLSKETKLSNLIATLNQFKQVYDTRSKQMDLFLGDSTIDTEITADVWTLDIINPDEVNMIAFQSNTSLLSEDMIQQMVTKKQKQEGFKGTLKTIQVHVSILEMEWISEQKLLVDFYRYISARDSDRFANDLIITVLQQQTFSTTLHIVFGVYCVFLLTSAIYLSDILFRETPNGFWDGAGATTCRFFIVTTAIILAYFEYGRLLNGQTKKWYHLWENLWIICTLVMTLIVVFSHVYNYDPSDVNQKAWISQLASVTMVLQWCMFIYWLRIFKHLALYVILVKRTIQDIALFMIMFFGCILTFANAIYILNRSRLQVQPMSGAAIEPVMMGNSTIEIEATEEIAPLFSSAFSNGMIDAIFNQYMTSLGEFSTDNYAGEPWIIWVFFIISSFATQLMILNMLVAVMGKTLGTVYENKAHLLLQIQTQAEADWLWLNYKDWNSYKTARRYVYRIRPIIQQLVENTVVKSDQMQTAITAVQEQVGKNETKIADFHKQQSVICLSVEEVQRQIDAVQQKINDQSKTLHEILMFLRDK